MYQQRLERVQQPLLLLADEYIFNTYKLSFHANSRANSPPLLLDIFI